MANLFTHEEFNEFAKHSCDNEVEIVRSKKCGCYFCRSIFDARKVTDWVTDEKGTHALCPNCGMDAVIGDASGVPFDKAMLKEMNLDQFGDKYMDNHPEAMEVYCQRYINGNITHKELNEYQFIHYLMRLALEGNAKAAFTAAEFFDYGGEFLKPDLEAAETFYRSPILANNADALVALGRLALRKEASDGEDTYWTAYEAFSRAAALGNLDAVFELATCYMQGIYVDVNPKASFALLEGAYYEVLAEFCRTRKNYSTFVNYSFAMAKCYEKGSGVEKNHYAALRLFLCARLGYEQEDARMHIKGNSKIKRNIERHIAKLAEEFGYQKGEPVFDQDTFFDSFGDQQDSVYPKFFSPISYDEKAGEAEFEIQYVSNPLVIDTANLYCGFAEQSVRWTFSSLAYFKAEKKAIFERISSPDQDSWRFEHFDIESGNTLTVAELRFRSDPREVNAIVRDKEEEADHEEE